MVKMNNIRGRGGRQKPRPLFPPGELPLFGPPPAYMRRPPVPPPPIPPPVRGPMGPFGDYGPPPPPPLRPPHLGPPMPPLPHHPMNMRRRPGPPHPPPPMPLLQAPVMPPRGMPPFMRGRPMPRMGGPPNKKMKKGKNKKNKNKPNKPEGDYFCEVCDRSWETQEELDKHTSEHEKCTFEGCVYVAAPKLVALHIKLQHESGVFDRIVKSYDAEDIKKWKEERKRNYPTYENIQKKLAEKKEMEERGERIAANTPFKNRKGFSAIKDSKHGNPKSKLRERKRRKKPVHNEKTQFLTTGSVTEDMIVDEEKETKEDEKFSDEEWLGDNKGSKPEANISGVLMALGTSYASDSEDENVEEIPSFKIVKSENNDEPPSELKISRESDETPNIFVEMSEKKECEKQETAENQTLKKEPLRKQSSHHQGQKTQWNTSVRKRPLTLLEKLLADEIKRERNQILQCVRYIVKENFFAKDS